MLGEPYGRVEDLRRALADTEDWPVRVGRSRRAMHLLVQAGLVFLALPFVALALLRMNDREGLGLGLTVPLLIMLANMVWAGLARGGVSLWLCGLALVRADGRRAARWQAALRCFLAWAQAYVVVFGSGTAWVYLAAPLFPKTYDAVPLFWLVSPGCLLLYAVLAVWLPRRPLHDRLARTYLVPK
jgi:hypothetical protein